MNAFLGRSGIRLSFAALAAINVGGGASCHGGETTKAPGDDAASMDVAATEAASEAASEASFCATGCIQDNGQCYDFGPGPVLNVDNAHCGTLIGRTCRDCTAMGMYCVYEEGVDGPRCACQGTQTPQCSSSGSSSGSASGGLGDSSTEASGVDAASGDP